MINIVLILVLYQATTIQDITFDRQQLLIVPDNEYTRLMYPGCELTDEVGAPELPVMSVMVALPRGAKVTSVTVLDSRSHELPQTMYVAFARKPVILSQSPHPEESNPSKEIYS